MSKYNLGYANYRLVFNPFWFTSVHFSPLHSTSILLVHFSPFNLFRFNLVHLLYLVHSVQFSLFRTNSVHPVYFGHFSPLQSIQSNLVQFDLFQSVRSIWFNSVQLSPLWSTLDFSKFSPFSLLQSIWSIQFTLVYSIQFGTIQSVLFTSFHLDYFGPFSQIRCTYLRMEKKKSLS